MSKTSSIEGESRPSIRARARAASISDWLARGLGPQEISLPSSPESGPGRALIDGRLSPSIDDVLDMAEPILKHRMALTFAARADGETIEGVIGRLKQRIG